LSKQVKDLLEEFAAEECIQSDFNLHILKVSVDENGEIEEMGNALPVFNIEIDSESQTVLLHYIESSDALVSVADAKAILTDELLDYEVCAAQITETAEAVLRAETPFIGFGENVELKCFFGVCQE